LDSSTAWGLTLFLSLICSQKALFRYDAKGRKGPGNYLNRRRLHEVMAAKALHSSLSAIYEINAPVAIEGTHHIPKASIRQTRGE
ncbi:MAG: hypothetical protein QF758_01160, partial [Alphaproteobacteria bacterium]|nr:hypothetical protein [Alphaproteobacteria bacterium]